VFFFSTSDPTDPVENLQVKRLVEVPGKALKVDPEKAKNDSKNLSFCIIEGSIFNNPFFIDFSTLSVKMGLYYNGIRTGSSQ
jgi:hypothetical protein